LDNPPFGGLRTTLSGFNCGLCRRLLRASLELGV